MQRLLDGGCPDVATKYMLEANEEGVPVDADGKYTGDEELTIVVSNTPDGVRQAESLQQDLSQLGLDVKIRGVPQDTLYTKFLGVPKNQPAIGSRRRLDQGLPGSGDADRADLPVEHDPPGGQRQLVELRSRTRSTRPSRRRRTCSPGPDRNQAWADANKAIVNEAPAILTTWDDNINLQSKKCGPGDELLQLKLGPEFHVPEVGRTEWAAPFGAPPASSSSREGWVGRQFLGLAIAAALMGAGCGGDDSGSDGGSKPTTGAGEAGNTTAPEDAKKGGHPDDAVQRRHRHLGPVQDRPAAIRGRRHVSSSRAQSVDARGRRSPLNDFVPDRSRHDDIATHDRQQVKNAYAGEIDQRRAVGDDYHTSPAQRRSFVMVSSSRWKSSTS